MLHKFLFTWRPWKKYAVKIISFTMVCAATLVFMLCISAFMIIRVDTPDYVLIPLTTVLLTFSSFIDSFFLAKAMKENGIITGITIGVIFTVIVILLAVYYNTLSFSTIFFSKVSAVILAGILGGILGLNS